VTDNPLADQILQAEALLQAYENQITTFRDKKIVPLRAMIDEMRTLLAEEEKTDGS
jgi:hypothetical protein